MSDLDPRVIKLLDDITTSAKRAAEYLQDETLESFTSEAGMGVQDMVARRLTVIGEAAAALLKKHSAFCEQHPEIPLRLARGMRNVIVHEYDGVDWKAVWDTTQNKLQHLIDAIETKKKKKL
jgi:uncharacterized protein with HEPN domain